jgi:transposase
VSVYCGIDWSERHHDVALIDDAGQLVARKRIGESVEGLTELLDMLAAAGDTAEHPIPVAIETPRGLLVAALRATGRPIYPINPMAVARYRDRYTVSRGKSDHVDATVLANILRTDAHVHRVLPADTALVRAIAVLARAHQDAIWRRVKLLQELRAVLREYYPGFLAAFGTQATNLASPDARAVLAIAPTPAAAAGLSQQRIATALRRAGRQRRIAATAERIRHHLRQPQLRHDPQVEDAMGTHALALLEVLNATCHSEQRLAQAAVEAFRQHPDHDIIISFPGLADVTGARVLAEIGDCRDRFTDPRALKAYAGSAPITRASGRTTTITRRRIKNDRLCAVGYVWAFMAITNSASARAHYDHRRAIGDRHAAALRHLFNRLLGQLHHCLATRQTYNDAKAFPPPLPAAA